MNNIDSIQKRRKDKDINLALYIPKGWNKKTWEGVLAVIPKMTRQQLIMTWLESSLDEVTDERFNQNLIDLSAFSRQELIDLIHEIGQEDGKKLIQRCKFFC